MGTSFMKALEKIWLPEPGAEFRVLPLTAALVVYISGSPQETCLSAWDDDGVFIDQGGVNHQVDLVTPSIPTSP